MRKKLISIGLAATTAVSATAFSTQAAAEHRSMSHAYTEFDGQPHRVDPGAINLGLAVDVEHKDGYVYYPSRRSPNGGEQKAGNAQFTARYRPTGPPGFARPEPD